MATDLKTESTNEYPMVRHIGHIGVITSQELVQEMLENGELKLEQEAVINPECVVLDNY